MKLNRTGVLNNKEEWLSKGYDLPHFDIDAMAAATKAAPVWVHFGAGNIFRAFQRVFPNLFGLLWNIFRTFVAGFWNIFHLFVVWPNGVIADNVAVGWHRSMMRLRDILDAGMNIAHIAFVDFALYQHSKYEAHDDGQQDEYSLLHLYVMFTLSPRFNALSIAA